MGERVEEIAVGVLDQALERYRTTGGIADELFQLIPPVGWDVGVGVQRKPLDAGTVGTGERWRLTLVAKPGANTPHLLAGPLAEGNALLHGGGHGTGQLRRVVKQGIISRGYGGVDARFQVPELPQFAHAAPAVLLDHVGDVGVSRGLARKKPRRAPLVGRT